ncbi:hypothetical protein PIB30_057223 [Stylosanthes scabra]|uniref:CRC domain-containing protein n=1 Tax=Stylosanthes scabra TaxID=79078 RepID=A0ABU6ZIA7_9FABA|nr:hypothetical protein [Stylosanthes scabra]
MASCESSGDRMNVGASDFDGNDGSKKKRKQSCNCHKSQCLQLYCECFSSGNFCNDYCSCKACMNNVENKDCVKEKKKEIESRNPHAFQCKIIHAQNESARHRKGCCCNKTKCDNKYCPCFRADVGCSRLCRCQGCKNVHGSKKDEHQQEQEERVLSNNNNNGSNNNGMLNNGSSSQSHHPVANNDNFLPHHEFPEPDVDIGNNENGIYSNNVNMPLNQVSVAPADSYYNYNSFGNFFQNHVAASDYHHPLASSQILSFENNTVEQQNINMMLDLLNFQQPPSFLGPHGIYNNHNNVADEPSSSIHNLSTMAPIIQSTHQQYRPQTRSYGNYHQEESGAMNHSHQLLVPVSAQRGSNDATNMHTPSDPIHPHGPPPSSGNNADYAELPHGNMFLQHNNKRH